MQETEAVERTERSIIFYTHTYKILRVHYFIREVLQVALRDAVTSYDVSSKRDVSYDGSEAQSIPDRNWILEIGAMEPCTKVSAVISKTVSRPKKIERRTWDLRHLRSWNGSLMKCWRFELAGHEVWSFRLSRELLTWCFPISIKSQCSCAKRAHIWIWQYIALQDAYHGLILYIQSAKTTVRVMAIRVIKKNVHATEIKGHRPSRRDVKRSRRDVKRSRRDVKRSRKGSMVTIHWT